MDREEEPRSSGEERIARLPAHDANDERRRDSDGRQIRQMEEGRGEAPEPAVEPERRDVEESEVTVARRLRRGGGDLRDEAPVVGEEREPESGERRRRGRQRGDHRSVARDHAAGDADGVVPYFVLSPERPRHTSATLPSIILCPSCGPHAGGPPISGSFVAGY